ncbi:hypothetical protein BCT01_13290 [Vibrio tasmaniensis]|jgi:hypothetical protein|nr:hypothetical protein BCT01_13290 [Vibrio tasmaniensis]
MNTKSVLLDYIDRANANGDNCYKQLLVLMRESVARTDAEEIDWHMINDLLEADVLLLIVLTDMDLTIQYHEYVLMHAVTFVMKFDNHILH